MQVRILQKHTYPIKYQTSGACAFDFCAIEDVTFSPGEWKLIDTGTVIETPKGYALVIVPRSSTFKNYGLMQVNSIGIIDQDYCGDNDTIKFAYINMQKDPVTVRSGERVGQGMLVAIAQADFIQVDTMQQQDRGGFGTTGI